MREFAPYKHIKYKYKDLPKNLISLFTSLFLKVFKISNEQVFFSKLISYSLIDYFAIES